MAIIQPVAGELEPHPDVALVERVRAGDVSAYDALVRKYERQIFRISQHITQNREDAEDVVQDAFLRWLDVDRDGVREPAAFLRRVVTRLCLDKLKSAQRTRETYVGPWLPEPVVEATRDEVVAWIREKDVDLEQLDTVFLIDTDAKFSGAVSLGRLLFAPADEPMDTLKAEPLLSVAPDAGQKEVFELFDKYNLHSLAVVDEEGRPIGAIEVDDIVTRLRNR